MRTFQAVYYNPEHVVKPHTFYVLCKGQNSGRPMLAPCPNCFAITCSNDQDKDFLFTLCFALWKGNAFKFLLTGSVIEFIRMHDFKKLLRTHAERLEANSAFLQTVEHVRTIEANEAAVKQQLQLLHGLKTTMLARFFR